MPKKTKPASLDSKNDESKPKEANLYEEAAKSLENLLQPWNPVIRTAIAMLRSNSAAKVCSVSKIHYSYAELVQLNGRWRSSKNSTKLTHHEETSAVGIVLYGRVEAVTLSDISSELEFSVVRPWPRSILRPGMLIGAFEFTGRVYQRPEKHNYRLYAGPVCLQFDHPELSAFHQKKIGKKHKGNPLSELLRKKDSTADKSFEEWHSGWREKGQNGQPDRAFRGENFKLIEAIADANSVAADHAIVLFISLNDAEISASLDKDHCKAFRRSISEEAWHQSLPFRSKVFRDVKLKQYKLSNPAVPAHQPSIRATLDHLDGALISGDPIWASPSDVNLYPAIRSFVEKLSGSLHKNLSGDKAFGLSQLYFANTLIFTKKNGCLTIDDYIELQCCYKNKTNVKGARRIGTGLSVIVTQFIETIAHISNSGDLFPCKLAVKSEVTNHKIYASPFKRMAVEISAGLETLPILNWIETNQTSVETLDLQGTLIVACQHLLRETCCWLSHLQSAGAKIIVVGKDYSTSAPIAMRMRRLGMEIIEDASWTWDVGRYSTFLREKVKKAWGFATELVKRESNINKVLVIDDGGFLLDTIPKFASSISVGCVEQTTSGKKSAEKAAKSYPVVDVAGFKLKRLYESKMIADVIIERTETHCPIFGDTETPVSVIGLGAIGTALVERLHGSGRKVFVFAKDPWNPPKSIQNASRIHDPRSTAIDVVSRAGVIFGCAGEDVLKETSNFKTLAGKWFASCGSMDSEFATLLQNGTAVLQRKHNPFSTVNVRAGNGFAHILNGGFPVNFDRELDSVKLEKIQLTRSYMHAAVIQLLNLGPSIKGMIALEYPDVEEADHRKQLKAVLGFNLEDI